MSTGSLLETSRRETLRSRARSTVLVVEDEPVLRESMMRGLAKLEGVDIVCAANVSDARRSVRHSPPDFCITDLDLPDGSGIEVVAELDRVGLRVPIAIVSAFVGRYRGRLPNRPGIEVFEKPISLERLRRLVDERLNGDVDPPSSPFGVADYIQLAGMGRRSVVVEVRGRIVGRGEIVIKAGEVWSANDEQGSGLDAFRRLAFLEDAVVTCRPFDGVDAAERNVTGSCESVLLEAARRHDENEGAVDDGWTEASEETPTDVTPRTSALAARAFDELYEQGVEALLHKRFDDAFRAFSSAEATAPGDSRVHANLTRLKQMGYGT